MYIDMIMMNKMLRDMFARLDQIIQRDTHFSVVKFQRNKI